MTLEINEQERNFLFDVLKAEHSSLLDEIHHTDGYEYKQLLKQRLELLNGLKSRVGASPSDTSTT
jgi:hypothetical protein